MANKMEINNTDDTIVEKHNKKCVYTAEEKKLLRKIQFIIVPFICVIIFNQFLDKAALNFSTAMGFFEETQINGTQFSWLGSVFYLGYLLSQVPNQYLLQYFSISKFLGTYLIFWGIMLGCTAFGNSFTHFAALRFLQGFFEAAAYPSLELLVCTIFRRSEQVFYFGLIFGFNSVAGAFGGLIGFGFLSLNGVHGISGWRWCMIILGATTIILGGITFIFLPDKAKSRWFRLTTNEINIVEGRIRDNGVVESKIIKYSHIFEALQERQFYCYTVITMLISLLNGCTTLFSTMIIKNMGFSNLESILLDIPKNTAHLTVIAITVYLSHRYNENNYIGMGISLLNCIAALLLTVLPRNGLMLTGLFLANPVSAMIILVSSISNNVNGYTKKVFYNGSVLVAYCCGNFVGPLLMRPSEAPRYTSAMVTYTAAMFIAATLFLVARRKYVQDNCYRRQLIEASNLSFYNEEEKYDVTDKHDLRFIYRP